MRFLVKLFHQVNVVTGSLLRSRFFSLQLLMEWIAGCYETSYGTGIRMI